MLDYRCTISDLVANNLDIDLIHYLLGKGSNIGGATAVRNKLILQGNAVE
jgi:hypothetical protein